MFNAAKSLSVIIILSVVLGACSGDGGRGKEASELVARARAYAAEHRYDSALVVLDTLDKHYRECLEQRREGTSVRLEAMASMSRDSLAAAEIRLRAVNEELGALEGKFRKVDIAGTAGYLVAKSVYKGDEMNRNGIQARIDEDGYCSLVANVAGRRIGLDRIEIGNVSTPPGKSIEIEGSEIMSVMQENAAPVLDAISEMSGKAVVTLVGGKGKVNVTLTPAECEAIAETWQYARALQQQRALNITLEKLERQVAKLSDQLAGQMDY